MGDVGPKGDKGDTGSPGTQGPSGTTTLSSSGALDPPATRGLLYGQSTVTVAKAGTMMAFARAASLEIDPTPQNSCPATVGLYVDGVPVPGSAQRYVVSVPTTTALSTFGTIPVAAGARSVELAATSNCTTTDMRWVATGGIVGD